MSRPSPSLCSRPFGLCSLSPWCWAPSPRLCGHGHGGISFQSVCLVSNLPLERLLWKADAGLCYFCLCPRILHVAGDRGTQDGLKGEMAFCPSTFYVPEALPVRVSSLCSHSNPGKSFVTVLQRGECQGSGRRHTRQHIATTGEKEDLSPDP